MRSAHPRHTHPAPESRVAMGRRRVPHRPRGTSHVQNHRQVARRTRPRQGQRARQIMEGNDHQPRLTGSCRKRTAAETQYGGRNGLHPAARAPPVPTAVEQELLERARELMAELLASERNWVVRRTASKHEAKTDWEPLEKIIRGPLKHLVPEGYEFSLHSHGESWYRESPTVVTAALLPLDVWVTPDT